MSRRLQLALTALVLLAVVGFVLFSIGHSASERPQGSGDVGVLRVYAQRADGPARLPPSRLVRLQRPQDFTFRLMVEGSGPRWVRVALEVEPDPPTVLFEEQFQAPHDGYLDYVLRLSEGDPDRATLVVTVEAPHMMSAVSRFPVVLQGGDTPFWEPKTATTAR